MERLRTIPFDQQEELAEAPVNSPVIEIIKPVWNIPREWQKEEWEEFRRNILYLSRPEPDKVIYPVGKRRVLEKTGGGLLGKGNINIDIQPLIVTHEALYFYVKHWRIIE